MSPLIAKAHTISTVLIWQLNGALGAIFRAEICFDSDLLSSSSSSGGEMARIQNFFFFFFYFLENIFSLPREEEEDLFGCWGISSTSASEKNIEKQNDTLVIGERAIKFLFSNFEQGLQYRIRKYLPNCDIYIYIPIYILIHIKIGLRLMDTLHK